MFCRVFKCVFCDCVAAAACNWCKLDRERVVKSPATLEATLYMGSSADDLRADSTQYDCECYNYYYYYWWVSFMRPGLVLSYRESVFMSGWEVFIKDRLLRELISSLGGKLIPVLGLGATENGARFI